MRKPFAGWWLTGVVAVALVAMVAAILAAGAAGEASFHAAVRATARTSLVLFVLAFTASSLRRLHASPATAWLLANRRYVGVSFAASHALHLATIVAIAARWPTRSIVEAPPLSLVPGASVYLFVLAMAATSSDRAVAWLGLRRWRALHKVGAYLIWFAFAEAYVPRALKEPAYAAPAAITLAALAVRVMARVRRRRTLASRTSPPSPT